MYYLIFGWGGGEGVRCKTEHLGKRYIKFSRV